MGYNSFSYGGPEGSAVTYKNSYQIKNITQIKRLQRKQKMWQRKQKMSQRK